MKAFIVRLGTLAATGTLAGALALAVSGPAGATSTGNHGQLRQQYFVTGGLLAQVRRMTV
jgi:hypothetical protein